MVLPRFFRVSGPRWVGAFASDLMSDDSAYRELSLTVKFGASEVGLPESLYSQNLPDSASVAKVCDCVSVAVGVQQTASSRADTADFDL